MKISKRLVACVATVLTMCMMLTACGTSVNKVVSAEDGIATGEVGTTFRTYFFDFSVDSVAFVSEYEGYTPSAEGMDLLDVVITIKNTFGEELPMFNSDFQVQWYDLGAGEGDFNFGVEMDDSNTVMPTEYGLPDGDTCSYHIIYEVPTEAKEFSICFMEFFSDNTIGDSFYANFDR